MLQGQGWEWFIWSWEEKSLGTVPWFRPGAGIPGLGFLGTLQGQSWAQGILSLEILCTWNSGNAAGTELGIVSLEPEGEKAGNCSLFWGWSGNSRECCRDRTGNCFSGARRRKGWELFPVLGLEREFPGMLQGQGWEWFICSREEKRLGTVPCFRPGAGIPGLGFPGTLQGQSWAQGIVSLEILCTWNFWECCRDRTGNCFSGAEQGWESFPGSSLEQEFPGIPRNAAGSELELCLRKSCQGGGGELRVFPLDIPGVFSLDIPGVFSLDIPGVFSQDIPSVLSLDIPGVLPGYSRCALPGFQELVSVDAGAAGK
ncbi:uncharacterized protein LOC120511067 [Passer montanus]|uniref:uncharacterized protein LOC120511067 n=1 Tax=Passer montanus TaxID=9160 RepID=UPI001961A2ED|nr:uncharacterized protein LOC120511067 [Passer montanus]